MKRGISIFFTVAVAFIVLSSYEHKNGQNCAMYKLGRFFIYNKTEGKKIYIERKDSLQIETDDKGDITILKLKWINECEYELSFNYTTPKEVSKKDVKQTVFELSAASPLHIKILSGTDSYYVFEASKEGFRPLKDTVWIIK